jgi:hypothetical protein
VRDAVGDDAGLAGTRSGEDQQRSFGMQDRLLLFVVQAREKIQAFILSAFARRAGATGGVYSTVTDFARFRG